MMKLFPLFLLAATSFVSTSHAGELDPAPAGVAPSGLIVQSDASGNTQVFKADGVAQVSDDASAQSAVSTYVTPANQISNPVPLSELDRTSSNQAWYYWYNGYNPYCGYNYGYNYFGYSYLYNPYYSWNYGGYYYYYYRRY